MTGPVVVQDGVEVFCLCPDCTRIDHRVELTPVDPERGLYTCPECSLLFTAPWAKVQS